MNKPQIFTKVVPLRFVNTSKASAFISVPFRVSMISTKTIIYEDDTDPVALSQYGLITSPSLVKNQPLGVFMSDYRYASYSGADNIIYKSQNPLDITGTYEFELKTIDNTSFTLTGSLMLILEFTEMI